LSQITPGKKRYVKRRLSFEKPTIWIGKSGVSAEILKEIEKQLDKNEMVKIKILRSAIGKEETKQIASHVANQIGASLVGVKGHIFMLYRRRKK